MHFDEWTCSKSLLANKHNKLYAIFEQNTQDALMNGPIVMITYRININSWITIHDTNTFPLVDIIKVYY